MLKRLFIFLMLIFCAPLPVLAVAVDTPLKDSKQETRARAIHKQLRCLVCQNQSIEDSNAELARDLRQLVREQIAAGRSDDEIIEFVVARYGDWVLLEPPLKRGTVALWSGPPLILLLAVLVIWVRRRRSTSSNAAIVDPLSLEERQQLAATLAGPRIDHEAEDEAE